MIYNQFMGQISLLRYIRLAENKQGEPNESHLIVSDMGRQEQKLQWKSETLNNMKRINLQDHM